MIFDFGAKMRCPRPLKMPQIGFDCLLMLPNDAYNIKRYIFFNFGSTVYSKATNECKKPKFACEKLGSKVD